MNMTKSAALPQNSSTLSLVKRLSAAYLKPLLPELLRAFALMIIAAAMTAGIALLMEPILDDVLGAGDTSMIVPVAIAIFTAFLLRGISTYGHTIIMTKISQSIVAQIQKDLFKHLMHLDLSFFHKNPSGTLLSLIVSDVNVMRMALSDTLTGVGKNLITLIFLIGVMFYKDWALTLAALLVVPFIAGFVIYLGKRLRQISGDTQQGIGALSDLLSQIFQASRQVKAYGMESYEQRRADEAIDTVKRLNIKNVRIGNLSTPVNEILVGVILVGVISYGGYQAAAGLMTPGELGAFLTAFIMAYEPMKKLSKLNNALQTGLGATQRVFDVMDKTPNIKNRKNAQKLYSKNPVIRFDNVDYRYEDTEDKALNKISFEASSGQVTALVGPSGGGKSTIMNMIPRLYDATDGKITVDDMDLRDIQIKSLRSHIALVSQDISIFNDTVRANIAYGNPEAGDDEIAEAAQMAAAEDFIKNMPEGYDTVLGEDGVKLSGGQRQRIAIARAILRNAPILLLDEATSALDNESESIVQSALKKLQKGRTTIAIAHRLSTVQDADQILVLNKGEIVERGRHEELLHKGGLYATMYQKGLKD